MSEHNHKAEDDAIVRLNLSSIVSAFVGAVSLAVLAWAGSQLLDQAQKMAVVVERQNELFRQQDEIKTIYRRQDERLSALERGQGNGQR